MADEPARFVVAVLDDAAREWKLQTEPDTLDLIGYETLEQATDRVAHLRAKGLDCALLALLD